MIRIDFAEKPAPERIALAGLWLPFFARADGNPMLCLTDDGFRMQGKSCHAAFSEPERTCMVMGPDEDELARILAVSWGAFCASSPKTARVEDWPRLGTSFSGPAFDGVTSPAFMMDMLRHLRFNSEFIAFFDDGEKSFAQFSDFFVECRYMDGMRIRACGPDRSKVEEAIGTIEKMGEMIYDTKPVRDGQDPPAPKMAQ